MRRFFLPADAFGEGTVLFSGEVLHHMRTVLRLDRGQEVLFLDGRGLICHCLIEQLDKNRGQARVQRRWQEPDSALPIRLLQALPKGDKMDLILQKGTELGVSRFVPVVCERCQGGLPEGRQAKRHQRWERIVQEAARQCCRPCLPELEDLEPLDRALAQVQEPLKLMLYEKGCRPLAEVLPATSPNGAALLVGPEGGFTEEEARKAQDAGFVPVLLGPRILRTETAGFAAAAVLQFRYGDLGGLS